LIAIFGWHHTGDTGRFDEEGYLFFVGKKAEKELIKPGGEMGTSFVNKNNSERI
jgi:acyl-CoA synthetase (AMP-forming)/AMP-acid ligase II